MPLDVETHLGDVERSVSVVERDGRRAGAVTLVRSLPAAVADLWDALTNPERLARWFVPIAGALRSGGRYQLEGHAGGVITLCERPSRLALTWEFGEDVSWVDVRLADEGVGVSGLSLTHTARLSEHWDKYGPGATGVGWELGLLGLRLHLTNPEAPKLDEAAFASSSDGRAFIIGSAERWGEAAVAAGVDAADARAAAGRTAAFYTGE